jgi:hypothetical protein
MNKAPAQVSYIEYILSAKTSLKFWRDLLTWHTPNIMSIRK